MYFCVASSAVCAEPGVKLRDRIKQAAPDGVDVLFDNVGGEQYDESLKTLKWGARILVIGFASGKIPKIPANIALVKNLTVSQFLCMHGTNRHCRFNLGKAEPEHDKLNPVGRIPKTLKSDRVENLWQGLTYTSPNDGNVCAYA